MDFALFAVLCSLLEISNLDSFSHYCQQEPKDYFFTLGTSTSIRVQEDFSVYLTLEQSPTPVNFNLTFTEEYSQFLKSPIISLNLNPGESRKVLIEVKDDEYFLQNKFILTKTSALNLQVIGFQPGLTNNGKTSNESIDISVHGKSLGTGYLVLEVDKSWGTYSTGMEINYRAFIMKDHYHLLHSPVSIKSELMSGYEVDKNVQTIWKEEQVIDKGLFVGSIKLLPTANRLTVTGNGQSLTFYPTHHRYHNIGTGDQHLLYFSVQMSKVLPLTGGKSAVSVSMFRSLKNIPTAASCFYTLFPNSRGDDDVFARNTNSKNFTLDWKTGRKDLELNIVDELKLNKELFEERILMEVSMSFVCTDVFTGEQKEFFEQMKIYKSMSTVDLTSVDVYHGLEFDSAVLTIKVGRRDKGPLSEKVSLILELSENTRKQLRHSDQTQFTKNVSSSGIVVHDFEVNHGTKFSNQDKVFVVFGDTDGIFD